MFGGHRGSAPAPFDALDGPRLAGPQGSHPLHHVRPEELVRSTDDSVAGDVTVDELVRVGGGIEGTIRVRALREIRGREAALRLVGLRLDETRQHREDRDSKGRVVRREDWVEARGRLFEERTFVEPRIPPELAAGSEWEGRFAIPAPRLGPPSAHVGESIVAWALEVWWDVPWGSDVRLAAYLPVAQGSRPDGCRRGTPGRPQPDDGIQRGGRAHRRRLGAAGARGRRDLSSRGLAVRAGWARCTRGAASAQQRSERRRWHPRFGGGCRGGAARRHRRMARAWRTATCSGSWSTAGFGPMQPWNAPSPSSEAGWAVAAGSGAVLSSMADSDHERYGWISDRPAGRGSSVGRARD